MFQNRLDIAKNGVLSVNEKTLPIEINSIINKFLPQMIYCDECKNTILFNKCMLSINYQQEMKPHPEKYRNDLMKKCSICKKINLCLKHQERAHLNAKKYRFNTEFMCDECCWDEIT